MKIATRCLALICLGWAVLARCEDGSSSVDLIFAGDIQLAETAGDLIAGGGDPFASVNEVLKTADVAIGNLECVIASKGAPMPKKPFTFRANPRVTSVLAQHFDVLSLANNHTGDYGHEAFVEQLDLLKHAGIASIGGGRDVVQARSPFIVEKHGLRIALLGYNAFYPRAFEAGPSWPGVAWAVREQVTADIVAARSVHRADLVIPFMHWGVEHEPATKKQRQLADQMIKAGADMVVGGHPHITQEVEYCRGKLVVYSLGNFVFNGFKDGPARQGWMLRVRLTKQGLTTWDTVPVHIDDVGVPHPMEDVASPAGDASKGTLEQRRALVDSPFAVKAAK